MRTRDYSRIKYELDGKIKVKGKKITLLNEVISSNISLSTKYEAILKENETRLSSEEIALILQGKAKDDFQPLLIDHDSNFNKLKTNIKLKLTQKIPFSYNIILKEYCKNPSSADSGESSDEEGNYSGFIREDHCNPVQIYFNGKQEVKIFYIESTSDVTNPKLANYINIGRIENLRDFIKINLNNGDIEVYGWIGKKQHDTFSCSILAIQDLKAMADIGKEELIKCFSFIEEDSRLQDIDFNPQNLHPQLCKNAQSIKFVKANLSNESNKTLSVSSKKHKILEEYVSEFSIKNSLTTQYRYADYKGYKYLTQGRKILEDIGEGTRLKEVIDYRRGEISQEDTQLGGEIGEGS